MNLLSRLIEQAVRRPGLLLVATAVLSVVALPVRLHALCVLQGAERRGEGTKAAFLCVKQLSTCGRGRNRCSLAASWDAVWATRRLCVV